MGKRKPSKPKAKPPDAPIVNDLGITLITPGGAFGLSEYEVHPPLPELTADRYRPVTMTDLPAGHLANIVHPDLDRCLQTPMPAPDAPLDEQVKTLVEWHQTVVGIGRKTAAVVWRMGKLLEQLRVKTAGHWEKWVDENLAPLGISKETARRYIRVAKYYGDPQLLETKTVTEAFEGADIIIRAKTEVDRIAAVTLAVENVTLSTTGTASGTVSIEGSGSAPPATRTVTISNISGSGRIGISIVAGTASDISGNTALAGGPSGLVTVKELSGQAACRHVSVLRGTALNASDVYDGSIVDCAQSAGALTVAKGTVACTLGSTLSQSVTFNDCADLGSQTITLRVRYTFGGGSGGGFGVSCCTATVGRHGNSVPSQQSGVGGYVLAFLMRHVFDGC